MELSKRLEKVIASVPICDSAVDIGCDHGYVAIELVRRNRVKKVYGTDINKRPLGLAEKNVKLSGFADKIELILSDGIEKVDAIFDSIIIAGMGGATIDHILRASEDKVKKAQTLILSPQSHLAKARKCIYDLGFCIESESLLNEDDQTYYIILAKKGEGKHFHKYEYSSYLIEKGDLAYYDLILKRIAKLEKLFNKVPDARRLELKSEIKELEIIADEIKRNSEKIRGFSAKGTC